jgi:hypothetical protein
MLFRANLSVFLALIFKYLMVLEVFEEEWKSLKDGRTQNSLLGYSAHHILVPRTCIP